jgi:hypothetical protein
MWADLQSTLNGAKGDGYEIEITIAIVDRSSGPMLIDDVVGISGIRMKYLVEQTALIPLGSLNYSAYHPTT